MSQTDSVTQSTSSPVDALRHKISQVQASIEQLPPRDRLALLILSVFLVLFLFGGGGYWLHHKANQAKDDADQERQLLLWMRGQAPHLQANTGTAQPLAALVQTAATQQGLTITSTDNGGHLMVTTTNQSFAVLGTWLTRLAQSGVQIDQLDIEQQATGQLQLQATLSKP